MKQESWGRVYRAARVAKGFFDRAQIVKTSLVEAHSVYYFLQKMLAAGYIVEIGRDGKRMIYQGTPLLRNTPVTPPALRKERRMNTDMDCCKADESEGVTGKFRIRLDGALGGAAQLLRETGDLPAVPVEVATRKEGAQWLN